MTALLVLVHGGAHGAWCWEPTLPFLDGPVLAVDLPPKSIRGVPSPEPAPPELATTTLDDWARSTIADIDAAGHARVVLVGHSMGGLTIAEVARRIPERIARLVFVSCMVPPEGGLVVDGVPAASRDAAGASGLGDADVARDGNALEHDAIRTMFCNDMDEAQTAFVVEHTGTEAFGVFAERVSRQGIPTDLPKTYVRLLRDQALLPSDQDAAIAALRASPGGTVDVVELDTGHDVMISAPEVLASTITAVAAGGA